MYVYMYVYMCVYICMYVCMYVYMYVCMCPHSSVGSIFPIAVSVRMVIWVKGRRWDSSGIFTKELHRPDLDTEVGGERVAAVMYYIMFLQCRKQLPHPPSGIRCLSYLFIYSSRRTEYYACVYLY